MKRWLISRLVTPGRVRRLIALALSWLIAKCVAGGTWDAVSTFPSWLRRLADFIERWNLVDAADERERLLADLVADAVTDEQVDRLIDEVAAMESRAASCTGEHGK